MVMLMVEKKMAVAQGGIELLCTVQLGKWIKLLCMVKLGEWIRERIPSSHLYPSPSRMIV